MHSAAVAVNIQGPHELQERTTQDQLAAPSPHRFGAHPGQHQAREIGDGDRSSERLTVIDYQSTNGTERDLF